MVFTKKENGVQGSIATVSFDAPPKQVQRLPLIVSALFESDRRAFLQILWSWHQKIFPPLQMQTTVGNHSKAGQWHTSRSLGVCRPSCWRRSTASMWAMLEVMAGEFSMTTRGRGEPKKKATQKRHKKKNAN